MIVTITMNPAVDKSTSVNKLVPEKKLRCTELITEAGGGGINVSKAIKELGGESLAVFPSGGINGQLIENYLTQKQINYKLIPVEHETRENIVVRETDTNSQYRFVMPGAALTGQEVEYCFQLLQKLQPSHLLLPAAVYHLVCPKTFSASWPLLPNGYMPAISLTPLVNPYNWPQKKGCIC